MASSTVSRSNKITGAFRVMSPLSPMDKAVNGSALNSVATLRVLIEVPAVTLMLLVAVAE